MHTQKIGHSDITSTTIGLGTYGIGGWLWGGADETNAARAIDAAIDAGITLIDTAPAYGMGLAEEIVGKAISNKRDKIILSTKCGLVWHTQEGNYFFDQAGKPVHRYLGAKSIKYEVEQSLKRLQTDYIDIYHTHWQDPTTPISETMQALLDLKQEGKIRAIGVSNVTVDEMEAYQMVGQLDVDQEEYSMIGRTLEDEILPYTMKHKISMLAYSPLALGLLSGKMGPEREFSGDDQRIDNPRFSVENRRNVKTLLDEFVPIAERHQITIPQLVIAWTAAQPGITHVLVGARNATQAIENAQAGNITLTDNDLNTMNTILNRHQSNIV